jgi:hypothetical protein
LLSAFSLPVKMKYTRYRQQHDQGEDFMHCTGHAADTPPRSLPFPAAAGLSSAEDFAEEERR